MTPGLALSIGALLVAAAGFVFTVRRDSRDVGERRHRLQQEGQDEEEKLSDFVVRQTENVVRGLQASNDELRKTAEEILRRLEAVTHERDGLLVERDDLRGRVWGLEQEVAGLKARGEVDRTTITRLETEISDVKRTAGGT